MNIDSDFINKLLSVDIVKFKDTLKLVSEDMVQGEEQFIYKYIRKYYKDTKGGKITYKAIKRKFPDFVQTKVKEDIVYFCNELKDRREYEILTRGVSNVQNSLFEKDLEKSRTELKTLGIKLGELSLLTSETALRGLSERKKDYIKVRSNDGIIGYTTGISIFDKNIGGIVDEMIILMGKRAIGKTFLSLFMANNIWTQLDGSIVYVTNEISPKKLLKRLDSIVCGFSYSKYRKGLLNKKEENKLKELSKIYKKRSEFYVIYGAGKSSSDIEYELLSLEPKLFIVDGLYLTYEGFNDSFKNTMTASRNYQRIISKYGIPGIFTTQMNEDNEAKYARAIEEDADIVVKMSQSPNLRTDKVMSLKFVKVREEKSDDEVFMNWDFDNWIFTEKSYDVPEEDAEVSFTKTLKLKKVTE